MRSLVWSLLGLASITVVHAQTVIPEAVACANCTVNVRTLLRLGDVEGPGAFARTPRRVVVDGKGRFWIAAGDLPLVFSPNGKFAASPIRKGDGPGELPSGGTPISVVPGDSIVLIDGPVGLVIDEALRSARRFSAPPVIGHVIPIRWPTTVFAVGNLQTRDLIGYPVHILDMDGSAVAVRRSASPTGQRLNPYAEDVNGKAVFGSNELWWSSAASYRLVQFDSVLRPLRTLERRPSWWTSPSSNVLGNRNTPPQPFIAAARFDDAGLLWVFIQIPTKNWAEAWKKLPRGAAEMREGVIDPTELHTTLLEVVDVARGRVLVRKELQRYVISALPGGRVAVLGETPDGVPIAEILALTLTGR